LGALSNERYIIGLGNPGKDYEWTRHNLGFLVVDKLAEQLGCKFQKSSLTKSVVANGLVDEQTVHLVKPMTFMNNSGQALRELVYKKGCDLNDVLIVCDDLALSFGEIRLKTQGSAGGHNGLKSIGEHLGTKDFNRLRLGVGHPGDRHQVVDFVLGQFNKIEKKELSLFIEKATQCAMTWVKEGITQAMDQYNRRKE
jgi:PTH1 family peptidyl-tRNA hydrolase